MEAYTFECLSKGILVFKAYTYPKTCNHRRLWSFNNIVISCPITSHIFTKLEPDPTYRLTHSSSHILTASCLLICSLCLWFYFYYWTFCSPLPEMLGFQLFHSISHIKVLYTSRYPGILSICLGDHHVNVLASTQEFVHKSNSSWEKPYIWCQFKSWGHMNFPVRSDFALEEEHRDTTQIRWGSWKECWVHFSSIYSSAFLSTFSKSCVCRGISFKQSFLLHWFVVC